MLFLQTIWKRTQFLFILKQNTSVWIPGFPYVGRNVSDSNSNRAANREQAVTVTIECQVCDYQMQVGQ